MFVRQISSIESECIFYYKDAEKMRDLSRVFLHSEEIANVLCQKNNWTFFFQFDFESVKRYLEEGAEVNTQDNNRWTPLHEVVIKQEAIDIVKILLEYGANPNVPGGDIHSTPLHQAATCGCIDICKVLIQKGASKLARDANFNTPM